MEFSFKKLVLATALGVALSGCASDNQNASTFDESLYSGKPIDSLTNQEPPKTEKEAIERGDRALTSQNYDLALYEYIRSLSLEDATHQAKTLYTIGRIHAAKGDVALAEKAYLKSIDEDPNGVKPLEELGLIYTKQGLVDEGQAYFFRAINADQVRLNNPNTLTSYADVTEDTLRALPYDSESPYRSYMGLGVLSDVDQKHDLAKRYYERALEIAPTSTQALVNLGYSHYMSGGYYLAQRITNRALKKEPGNEKALNNLALIYIALGDNRQALNIFKRNMSEPEALNNVGYFVMLRGDPEEAIPYFQQAIDKNPSYYKVANENLERALSEVRLRKVEPIESKS
ncbi:flp pilus assembly protein tadD [Vibrio ishigakensis]|uniref:Flp pilus assembly protein tadD n=1 Tax=Vibrio ishigakensis TaxID=1481914 RepID=A0A0B8QU49_9VIBR|nr:flp pilus assembly protein tadD [Vibrio ishigakensis]